MYFIYLFIFSVFLSLSSSVKLVYLFFFSRKRTKSKICKKMSLFILVCSLFLCVLLFYNIVVVCIFRFFFFVYVLLLLCFVNQLECGFSLSSSSMSIHICIETLKPKSWLHENFSFLHTNKSDQSCFCSFKPHRAEMVGISFLFLVFLFVSCRPYTLFCECVLLSQLFHLFRFGGDRIWLLCPLIKLS